MSIMDAKEARPVDDPTALVPFGWAPGGYYCASCASCGQSHSGSDKRSSRCQDCAEALRDAPPSETPSNANTSGLEYYGFRAFNAGIGVCHLVANPGLNDTNPEPLVTAASAQAAIDAEKARADRLAKALEAARGTLDAIDCPLTTDRTVAGAAKHAVKRIDAALQQEG